MRSVGIDLSTFQPNEYFVLTSVVLSSGVEEIAEGAFAYTNITNISLPGSLTTIGSVAFAGIKISVITVPEGVTTIENCAFQENEFLTTLYLPSTLTTFERDGDNFTNCTSLTKFQINKTAEEIKSISGYPFADEVENIIYDKDGNLVPYSE